LTYRYGPHATADDPTRYRTDDEVAGWRKKDPIDRMRRFLENRDLLDEREVEKVAMEVTDAVNGAIAEIEARPLPDRDDAVRHGDRKSTRLNSSHVKISYAVFCLKK